MITNNIACVAGGSCEQPILGGGGTIFSSRPTRKFASGEAASEIPLDRSPISTSSTPHRSPRGFAAHLHGFATKTEAFAREIPPAMQTTNNRIQHLNGGRSNLKKRKEVNRNRKRLSHKQRHSPLRISEHKKHAENLNKSRRKKNGNF